MLALRWIFAVNVIRSGMAGETREEAGIYLERRYCPVCLSRTISFDL